MGSPATGKCVLEGKTLRKQQAPRPPTFTDATSWWDWVVHRRARGLGKFFSPPLFWNYFLGNHWRGCAGGFAGFAGFSCCPGNPAPQVCCSTRAFAWGMFFPFLRITVASVKIFCLGWTKCYKFSPLKWSPQWFFSPPIEMHSDILVQLVKKLFFPPEI